LSTRPTKEDGVNEPVAYVSTWRIKEGNFEDFRRFHAELVKIVDEDEPRVIAFLAFANEDGTEMTNIHVFAETATVDSHMEVLAEKMGLLGDDLTAAFSTWSRCTFPYSAHQATGPRRWTRD
jgi:hypothetical protein